MGDTLRPHLASSPSSRIDDCVGRETGLNVQIASSYHITCQGKSAYSDRTVLREVSAAVTA